MYKTWGKIHARSNQLNHPCSQDIGLCVNRMYIRTLYPINDIKALIFHLIVHQDSESIPVLVCKCIIIPTLYQSQTQSHLTDTTTLLTC